MGDIFNPQRLDENEMIWRDDNSAEDWQYSLDPDTDDVLHAEQRAKKLWPLQLAAVLVLLIFVGRLLQLQVAVGAQYKNLSAGNSLRAIRIAADRGLIFDQKGNVLARNTKRSSLALRVESLPETLPEREVLYQKIRKITDLPTENTDELERLRGAVVGDYAINTELNKEQILLLNELSYTEPSVVIHESFVREYDTSFGLSNIIGYTGQVNEDDVARGYSNLDTIGKAGIEKTYEEQLRGLFGIQEVEVDSQGRIGRTVASDNNRDAETGVGLRLGIDLEFQQQVAEALVKAVAKREEEFGKSPTLGATVIAMDPRSGIIRALVTYPSYDNNLFAKGISKDDLNNLYNDPGRPLFNRALSGTYPPGSTIKPLIASGALYYNTVSPNYAIDTPPSIEIGEFSFPDWKDHGMTNIQTAIAESNNIFFYALGGGWQSISGLGLERIRNTLHWFGLESVTGIDIGSENTGLILSEEWKREVKDEPVYLGDVYHLSIGQGDIAVTPIQMTAAIGAIANGGTLYEPRTVEVLVDTKNNPIEEITPPVKDQLPISDSELQIVRNGMRQAVEAGSSTPLNTLTTKLAGKTGTAQFGNEGRTHAWFTGFGPFENPEIVITILVEGGGGSFEAAIPLAEEIFRDYFHEPKE